MPEPVVSQPEPLEVSPLPPFVGPPVDFGATVQAEREATEVVRPARRFRLSPREVGASLRQALRGGAEIAGAVAGVAERIALPLELRAPPETVRTQTWLELQPDMYRQLSDVINVPSEFIKAINRLKIPPTRATPHAGPTIRDVLEWRKWALKFQKRGGALQDVLREATDPAGGVGLLRALGAPAEALGASAVEAAQILTEEAEAEVGLHGEPIVQDPLLRILGAGARQFKEAGGMPGGPDALTPEEVAFGAEKIPEAAERRFGKAVSRDPWVQAAGLAEEILPPLIVEAFPAAMARAAATKARDAAVKITDNMFKTMLNAGVGADDAARAIVRDAARRGSDRFADIAAAAYRAAHKTTHTASVTLDDAPALGLSLRKAVNTTPEVADFARRTDELVPWKPFLPETATDEQLEAAARLQAYLSEKIARANSIRVGRGDAPLTMGDAQKLAIKQQGITGKTIMQMNALETKNFADDVLSSVDRAGIVKAARSPEYVFKGTGIWRRVDEAQNAINRDLENYIGRTQNRVAAVRKSLESEAKRRGWSVKDTYIRFLKMRAGEDTPKTLSEQKILGRLESLWDDMAARRAEAGLETIKDNYFTKLFIDKPTAYRGTRTRVEGEAQETVEQFLARGGDPDIPRALEANIKETVRLQHSIPAKAAMMQEAQHLPANLKSAAEDLANVMLGRRFRGMGNEFARKLARFFHFQKLSFSPAKPARNFLVQGLGHNFAEFGADNLAHGLKTFRTKDGELLRRAATRTHGLRELAGTEQALGELAGKSFGSADEYASHLLDRISEVGLKWYRTSEVQWNKTIGFHAGFRRELKELASAGDEGAKALLKGDRWKELSRAVLSGQEANLKSFIDSGEWSAWQRAIPKAQEAVRRVHFMYGMSDRPAFLRSPFFRAFGVFATWPVKRAEMVADWGEDVYKAYRLLQQGKEGASRLLLRRAMKPLRYLVGGKGLTVAGGVAGWNLRHSMFPDFVRGNFDPESLTTISAGLLFDVMKYWTATAEGKPETAERMKQKVIRALRHEGIARLVEGAQAMARGETRYPSRSKIKSFFGIQEGAKKDDMGAVEALMHMLGAPTERSFRERESIQEVGAEKEQRKARLVPYEERMLSLLRDGDRQGALEVATEAAELWQDTEGAQGYPFTSSTIRAVFQKATRTRRERAERTRPRPGSREEAEARLEREVGIREREEESW